MYIWVILTKLSGLAAMVMMIIILKRRYEVERQMHLRVSKEKWRGSRYWYKEDTNHNIYTYIYLYFCNFHHVNMKITKNKIILKTNLSLTLNNNLTEF